MEELKKDGNLNEENLEATVEENTLEQEVAEGVEIGEAPKADEGKTESVEEDADSLKEALNQKNEALLRTVAEYQNYRKRVEKEKQDLIKYANEKIMKDLIGVNDNFERAISAIDRENEEIAGVISGIEMIKKNFDDILERYGVKEIEAEGFEFNPEHHHAVMTEDREGVEGNTVLEVFQKGYTLHERVIRPAMVKVSN